MSSEKVFHFSREALGLNLQNISPLFAYIGCNESHHTYADYGLKPTLCLLKTTNIF